jgi:hypothetical protein
MMSSRLVVLRGPFTDVELREIIAVVSDIEARRPDEVFELSIDASDSDDDVQELLDMVNPLRPGYERVVKYWRRD